MSDTLQDLKDRDVDNLEFLMKNKQRHLYKDSNAAFVASGEMLRLAVLRCGVDLAKIMELHKDLGAVGELVSEALAQNGVRIETRPYTNPIDEWRSGVYVYKNNEIVSFIGGIKAGELGGFYIETTEQETLV